METTPLTQNLINKLFAIIRCGLDLDSELPTLTPEECNSILSFGTKQSMLPILYRGLKHFKIPEKIAKKYEPAHIKQIYLVIQLNEALKSVAAAFENVIFLMYRLKVQYEVMNLSNAY